MEEVKKEQIPYIGSRLRQHIPKIPETVFQASGMIVNGRKIWPVPTPLPIRPLNPGTDGSVPNEN